MASPQPSSLGDFLRRIAFDYVRYGYYRYVIRSIPEGKDLVCIDEKLQRTYGIVSCRTARTRKRRAGYALIQYLRWQHTFVLLATEGTSNDFEKLQSYDIHNTPLHLNGYSIGMTHGIVSIKVSYRVWRRVKKHVNLIALRSTEEIETTLASLPYYHFPGVLRQKRQLVSQVNRYRNRAGLPPVSVALPQDFHKRYRTSRKTDYCRH